MPTRFIAVSVAPTMSVRVSLDMVASDRSTDAVWVTACLVGGDARPAGQLPPATGHPPLAAAVLPTSVSR
jgi:hypothetical protein